MLSRINHDSPYSKGKPIRKIISIETISVKPDSAVIAVLQCFPVCLFRCGFAYGKGHASWSKILEALDYYGIYYAPRAVYTKCDSSRFPLCCTINNDNSLSFGIKTHSVV